MLAGKMIMREAPTIAENYPYGLSNKDIESDIQSYSREINLNKGKPTVSACYAPLIQLGQAEIQLRLARKTLWISISIGFLSLIISCVALGLSYSANHSSSEWEERQIDLLKDLNLNIEQLASEADVNSGFQEQLLFDLNSSVERLIEEIVINSNFESESSNNSIQPIADATAD
ncbi:hypothetical protein [Marinobacterium stanieri]|uniref:hypothetical protein n=1 Tax=Marinobacterium stanieri TaxID=49186 RepID=UPI003A934A08